MKGTNLVPLSATDITTLGLGKALYIDLGFFFPITIDMETMSGR